MSPKSLIFCSMIPAIWKSIQNIIVYYFNFYVSHIIFVSVEFEDNCGTHCPICGTSYDGASSLSNHMWQFHSEVMGTKKRGRPKKPMTSVCNLHFYTTCYWNKLFAKSPLRRALLLLVLYKLVENYNTQDDYPELTFSLQHKFISKIGQPYLKWPKCVPKLLFFFPF